MDKRERKWHYLAASLMLMFIAYMYASDSHAEDLSEVTIEQVEFLISACAATYGLVGDALDNDGYIDEGRRWAQFLIGFTEYNEGRAMALINARLIEAQAALEGGRPLDAYVKLADEDCIVIRDELLKISGTAVEEWYGSE